MKTKETTSQIKAETTNIATVFTATSETKKLRLDVSDVAYLAHLAKANNI